MTTLEHIKSLAVESLAKHESTLLWDHPGPDGREHAIRAWRFGKPNSGNMSVTIYAVPGRLIVAGDAGDLILTRCTDMVHWLTQSIGSDGYVLSKASSEFKSREYSSEKALEWLAELRKHWIDDEPDAAKVTADDFDDWAEDLGSGEQEMFDDVYHKVMMAGLDSGDYPCVMDYTPNLCWCYCILAKWLEVAKPEPMAELPGDVR